MRFLQNMFQYPGQKEHAYKQSQFDEYAWSVRVLCVWTNPAIDNLNLSLRPCRSQ